MGGVGWLLCLRYMVDMRLAERLFRRQTYDQALEVWISLLNVCGGYISLALLITLLIWCTAALRQKKNPGA
jgi:hypothetical protein